MNKNLKRLFVTTAIITSLTSTNNAHATGLVTQFWDVVHNLKNARNPFEKVEAVKEVKEHLQYRQEWINEPEDMTGSLMLNTSFIKKTLTDGENNPEVEAVIGILNELEPLKQAARKEKEEKKVRKALKLEKKQALEAQKREEEQRVKAELVRIQQEKADTKLKEEQAEKNKREKWEAEETELGKLKVIASNQPLNDSQKSRLHELEKNKAERKKEQAAVREEKKQKRDEERKKDKQNDDLCLHLKTNAKNRENGLLGKKEEDNGQDDYKADDIEEDNGEVDYKADDIDNHPRLPSYEKDTYNNVPFTQLSPAKQEKIIEEYKKGELERFYYEKAQAETTNKKNIWEKVPSVVKKAITDKYAEDKQKKIIEYYYIKYYKHNKRSFDQLSPEQRKQVERSFNSFIDKEEVKESYEWECDKNIRKIHSEDPQFKYNVAFFELNDGLQIRKKEEYIQKEEKKENKERKKQENEVKAKKKCRRASATYERTQRINSKTRSTAATTDKCRNTTENKKNKRSRIKNNRKQNK